MTIDDMDDYEIVQAVSGAIAGERALLTAAVRTSPDLVDDLLDDDFTEIGASGRLWTRPEIVEMMLAGDPDDAPISDSQMNGNLLTPDLVLLTYVSDRDGRRARRSSVWRRTDGRWRVLFHQGTLLS